MFDRDELEKTKRADAKTMAQDKALQERSKAVLIESDHHGYGYQWTWLGLPIIQLPSDILAVQEIIWEMKPDVIVETGIAWGGSVVLYASLLELIGKGRVIAVDKVLPELNIDEIMKYPFSNRITLHCGSSVDKEIYAKIKEGIEPSDSVMVLLDSNHTHDHVLEELQLYAPLVTKGQYLVVSDTIVEDIPPQEHRPRPWGPGNNPKSALNAYMAECDRFEVDAYINDKLLQTFTPDGYLKCTR